jgi:tetratricopeptide (TPR) repeat protein
LDDAIQVLERYLSARPDDPLAWEALVGIRLLFAQKRQDVGALQVALGAALTAARLHPADAGVLLNATEVALAAGRMDRAFELGWAAHRLAPDDARAAQTLERVLALQAEAPSDGRDPERDYRGGAARLNAGDPHGALPFLLAAAAHAPDHAFAGYALGRAYLLTGATRDAVATLEQYVQRHPSEADAWGLLGIARLNLYEPDPPVLITRRARLELERAIGRQPEVAEYHHALARCLQLEGDEAGRRRALERAAALGMEVARAQLARM